MSLESPEQIVKNKLEKTMLEDQNTKIVAHAEELVHITEGTAINFLGRILERATLYLYVIIVARMLDQKLFGLLMLGITIFNFAGTISRLGLDIGALRFVALYSGAGDKGRVKGVIVQSLKYTLIISIIVGSGLFLAAKPLLAKVFDKPNLEIVIKLLSLSLPFFSLMTMALIYTRAVQIMRYTVYGQNLFWPICNLALATIFFIAGFGLPGILAAHVVSLLLASVLSLYFLARTFPELRQTEAIPETRKLLRFSAPLLLTISLTFLVMWTDTLMLGYFRSSAEVGVYSAAMRTAMLTSMVLFSFNLIFAPMISDLYNKKEIHKLAQLFKTATKWIYTTSLPIFLLMVLLSKEIMGVFGRDFAAGTVPLMLLAFAQLVNASVGSVGVLLIMSGKQDIVMYNTLGIFVFNILVNYLLIPAWGMLGAAVASGISLIIFNLLMLLEVRILLKIHPYNRKFLSPTLFGLIAFGINLVVKSVFINLAEMYRLLILVSSFMFIFAFLIFKWGFHKEDAFIFNILRDKFRKAVTRKIKCDQTD